MTDMALIEKLSTALADIGHLHDCMEQVKSDVRRNHEAFEQLAKAQAADRARQTIIISLAVVVLNSLTAYLIKIM